MKLYTLTYPDPRSGVRQQIELLARSTGAALGMLLKLEPRLWASERLERVTVRPMGTLGST